MEETSKIHKAKRKKQIRLLVEVKYLLIQVVSFLGFLPVDGFLYFLGILVGFLGFKKQLFEMTGKTKALVATFFENETIEKE